MKVRWQAMAPFAVWLILVLLPAPAGLSVNQWRYFAVFAAAITGLVFESLPPGAVGLIAVAFAAIMRYVEPEPAKAITWALGGFSDPTVWLIVGAFVFAIGYRQSGLGRRIALALVRRLGGNTLGLGYAVALADLVLTPGTPSNTARSGGTIFPIVNNIPRIYGSEPGPTARKIGAYVMWTAFASTAVTSSMFITSLAPTLAMVLLVALFFWIHYFFSSLTSHTAAVLPIVLAVGLAMPGIPALPLSLLRVYSLGLMGVISPYATGPAPIYFGSGYVAKGEFWRLGLIFGVIYFVALVAIGVPWLLFVRG
jgi:di/tricarboxylate transporter